VQKGKIPHVFAVRTYKKVKYLEANDLRFGRGVKYLEANDPVFYRKGTYFHLEVKYLGTSIGSLC